MISHKPGKLHSTCTNCVPCLGGLFRTFRCPDVTMFSCQGVCAPTWFRIAIARMAIDIFKDGVTSRPFASSFNQTNVMLYRSISLLAAIVSLTALGQSSFNYNPDYDNDGCVGMPDLLGMLTLFGNCSEWSCGDALEYNGHHYATVDIGGQCWFAENLKSTSFRDGTPIPQLQNQAEWVGATSPGWCYYEDESGSELSDYGLLYNFYVRGGGQICPSGWKLPNDRDWRGKDYDEVVYGLQEWIAVEFPDIGLQSAGALRNIFPYEWSSEATTTNFFEMDVRPSGGRDVDGSFIPSRQSAHFHINNTFGGGYVNYVYINGASNSWSRSGVGVDEPIASYLKGAAVRCLKDSE